MDRFIASDVPRFSGKAQDWALWKLEMKIFLMRYSINMDAPQQQGTNKEKEFKTTVFAQAIMTAIPRKWLLVYGEHADDGYAAFRLIRQRFEQRDVGGKLEARRALYAVQLKNKLQAEAYVNEVLALRSRYAACGGELPDADAVEILVSGLTPEYTSIKDKLDEATDDDTLTWDDAVQLILHRVKRLQRESGLGGDAHDSAKRREGPKPAKRTCNYCHRQGHVEEECRTKARDNTSSRPRSRSAPSRPMPQSRRGTANQHAQRGAHRMQLRGPSQAQPSRTCYRCGQRGHIASTCTASLEQHQAYLSRMTARSGQRQHSYDDGAEHTLFMAERADEGESNKCDDTTWYIDTMASDSATANRELFISYRKYNGKLKGVGSAPIVGRGTVQRTAVLADGTETTIKFKALHVPTLDRHLISEPALRRNGHTFDTREEMLVLKDGLTVPTTRVNDYPVVVLYGSTPAMTTPATGKAQSLETWHQRFAHADYRTVKATASMVDGMRMSNSTIPEGLCIPCAESKMTKLPFPSAARSATSKGELVHVDLQGPAPELSRQGNLHVVMFVDDHTRFSHVYFIKQRGDVHSAFTQFLNDSEINPATCTVRIDNAPELEASVEQLGFKPPEITCPYTPEQNGVAERALTTMTADVIAMLSAAKLPTEMWEDAARHAVRVRNRLPKAGTDVTRFQAWYGSRPDVQHLRTFGCHAVILNPKETRAHKLTPRGTSVIHLGFAKNHKGYLFLDPITYQEVVSRHARFDETKSGGLLLKELDDREGDDLDEDYVDESVNTDGADTDEIEDTHDVTVTGARRSTRTRAKPSEFWHTAHIAMDEPSVLTGLSYRQVMLSRDSPEWRAAMDRELQQMHELDVWSVVPAAAATTKPIPSKWTFTKKQLPNGDVKYKARLCACGNYQRTDSYGETYAPAASQRVTRIFAALSVSLDGVQHHHIDVKGAYLHAPISEDVFMYPPRGLRVPAGHLCKLNKSMYGTHQANRNWVKYHRCGLINAGYKSLLSDACIFVKRDGNSFLLSEVHTDDADVLTNDKRMLDHYVETLASFCRVGSIEPMRHFCGITFDRKADGGVILHQTAYTMDKLNLFDMQEVRRRSTPAECKQLTKDAGDTTPLASNDTRRYQAIVGSLQWLANNTRPDITFSCNQLSKFNSAPTREHLRAAHQVLQYLRHNQRGLHYSKPAAPALTVTGYADSDWGSDTDDRKPYLGWCVLLDGNLVLWKTKKATCVALSTCQAEYMALAHCVQDVIYLRQLLGELDVGGTTAPSVVYCDNRSAKQGVETGSFSSKMRHVAIKYHFVRDHVEKGDIRVEWIQSSDNRSDAFTKPLQKHLFDKHAAVLTTHLA